MVGFHKGAQGFQIDFPNGWTVSVQFGIGNYCSNRSMGWSFNDIPEYIECDNAEIAAWPTDARVGDTGISNKDWYIFPDGDEVQGWQNPTKVLEFMNMIARKPNPESQEEIVMVKPCYVCDEEVLATDKECYKYIDGAYKYRHLWHGVPGITRAVGGGGGFNGYATTLVLARQRAEYYINSNPYAAPEVRQGEQEILDEVNRLENKVEGGEYLSECCDAIPVGELDSFPQLGDKDGDYYRAGFCSRCNDNAVFILELRS